MKSFICIALIIAISVCDAAVTLRHGQAEGVEGIEGVNQHVKDTAVEAEADVDTDVVRFRKSAKSMYGGGPYGGGFYGGSSSSSSGGAGPGPMISYTYPSPVPTVPCGKNLLFSCQPSVAPVPCMGPAPSSAPVYGHAGAYSEHIPVYAVPHYHEHIQQLHQYGPN